jgi:N-acetylglutamate synthase-like GNAT family acetyltransferase
MSGQNITIREAGSADRETIEELLTLSGLEAHAILEPSSRYWLALDAQSQVLGVIGLEYGNQVVLMRSAAVDPRARKRGIGSALMDWALESARGEGYRAVYLFSTDAGAYWTRQGFEEVPVSELVAVLPSSPQVLHYDQIGWLPTEIAWRRPL